MTELISQLEKLVEMASRAPVNMACYVDAVDLINFRDTLRIHMVLVGRVALSPTAYS